MSKKSTGPKVLLFDIETSPILAYVWGLWDQNIGLNQIVKDWGVLSWAAKWLDTGEIMYADQRAGISPLNEKRILKGMWKLLDECDVVVTQNGKAFDVKKLNAKFIAHGFKPPSPYKHIDTKQLAKKHFGFTSNSLEYMTKLLCKKYKKLTHKKFPGMELWTQCMLGNKAAWNEMEIYNKHDVLGLEELYQNLRPWDNSVNFNVYRDPGAEACNCGSAHFQRRGFDYTKTGKFQRFRCMECGAWSRGKTNLLSKEQRKALRA